MLFPEAITPQDRGLPDDTQIVTTLLYYSEPEMAEFKQLCKRGMMQLWPETFQQANLSDFLLNVLRQQYGNNNAKAQING